MGNSNPTADFVIEVIKMLDDSELRMVSEAINEQMADEKVIDIEPVSRGSSASSTLNSIAKSGFKLDQDSLLNLLSMLTGKDGLNKLITNSTSSSFPAANQLSNLLQLLSGLNQLKLPDNFFLSNLTKKIEQFLPKFMEITEKVMQEQSKEEKLFAAFIPFLPEDKQEQMHKMSGFFKFFQVIRYLKANK